MRPFLWLIIRLLVISVGNQLSFYNYWSISEIFSDDIDDNKCDLRGKYWNVNHVNSYLQFVKAINVNIRYQVDYTKHAFYVYLFNRQQQNIKK